MDVPTTEPPPVANTVQHRPSDDPSLTPKSQSNSKTSAQVSKRKQSASNQGKVKYGDLRIFTESR
jgi:hypothetical protein